MGKWAEELNPRMSHIWVPCHRQDWTKAGMPTRNTREKHWGQAPHRRHWALLVDFLLLNSPIRLMKRNEWEGLQGWVAELWTASTRGERSEVRKMLLHGHRIRQIYLTYWGSQQWRISFRATERYTLILIRITISNISKSCFQRIKTKPWKQTFYVSHNGNVSYTWKDHKDI